jgi:hypothetical protein
MGSGCGVFGAWVAMGVFLRPKAGAPRFAHVLASLKSWVPSL